MDFLYNIAEENGVMTSRSAYAALKYDYFIRKKVYSYLAPELLNDKFKDLNLRVAVGPGLGYQIWDDKIKSLGLEAGLSYFSEDLRSGPDKQWLTARFVGNLKAAATVWSGGALNSKGEVWRRCSKRSTGPGAGSIYWLAMRGSTAGAPSPGRPTRTHGAA